MLNGEIKLRELYIEVGSKCYLTCKHCSSEACAVANQSINTHKLCNVLKEGKELGANLLTISGGEPLLHEGLFDFVRFAKKNDYFVKMYSCGVLKDNDQYVSISDELFDKLKNAGVETIIFSLHGRPETHDYITSLKGSYEIAIDSIKRAIARKFKVEIHTVPMKVNYKEIPYIFQVADELGTIQVSLLRLVPQGRLRKNQDLDMTKEDYFKFKDITDNLEKKQVKLRLGSPYSCLTPDKVNCCSAGKNKLLIGPNGDVYPCEAFKTQLKGRTSNIYTSTLKEIWFNDPVLNTIRELSVYQIENCNNCKLSTHCMGGCHGQRLIANGSLAIGPDPICNIQ